MFSSNLPPILALTPAQDALAQRMGSVGLETSYTLPVQVYGNGSCDIDAPELGDHLACAEIAEDIFNNLRREEVGVYRGA